ncbi:sulfotransferase [Phaeobacter sp.]|uniref:sulfotransferase n=1 Tax=Phaeobacter sp. TaxID=1902409 RepID=UPI0025CD9F1C|nr:sulfotransferase [Phaeobacter sp.]
MKPLVINLGLPKSGTTTLATALSAGGFSVADHRLKERESRSDPDQERVFVGALLYQGLYESGDPMALMPEYDALAEISYIYGKHSVWPQFDFALLQALRHHHPEVKFIATRRDTAQHARSITFWSNLGTQRLPNSTVPGLPVGYGKTRDQQMRWIDGHYGALAQWFRNDPGYLEIDVADPDAQAAVSAFVGCDLPWWGKTNISQARTDET